MSHDYYHAGETIRLRAVITDDVTGDPVSPTTVTYSILGPEEEAPTDYTLASSSEVTEEDTGIIVFLKSFSAGGPYQWRMVATGPGACVKEGVFHVRPTVFP